MFYPIKSVLNKVLEKMLIKTKYQTKLIFETKWKSGHVIRNEAKRKLMTYRWKAYNEHENGFAWEYTVTVYDRHNLVLESRTTRSIEDAEAYDYELMKKFIDVPTPYVMKTA